MKQTSIFDFSPENDEVGEVWQNPKKGVSRNSVYTDYDSFIKKFAENPKTTDECYTPKEVYEVVLNFALNLCDFDPSAIIRPFYPNGDYENLSQYPAGCLVVDNPPFSILAKIVDFYVFHKIKFFLFAPSLTSLALARKEGVTFECCECLITYANKASINTSFVHNLTPEILFSVTPKLKKELEKVNADAKANLTKYEYPENTLTTAKALAYARGGTSVKIQRNESVYVANLDYLRNCNKSPFGGVFLLAENLPKPKPKPKPKNEINIIVLSDREKKIIENLKDEKRRI